MAREKTFFIGNEEDIAEYYHSVITGVVKISVGVGTTEDGEFKFLHPQNFEVYEITGEMYDQLLGENALIGKPSGTFRKSDLWEFIDTIRNNNPIGRIAESKGNNNIKNG